MMRDFRICTGTYGVKPKQHTMLTMVLPAIGLLKNGETWSGEFINRKKNGEEYFEKAKISPLRDESGEITQLLATKEDYTEQKQAEEEIRESEDYLRSIFKAVPVGIGTVNNRVFDTMNERMCEMLGYNNCESAHEVNK